MFLCFIQGKYKGSDRSHNEDEYPIENLEAAFIANGYGLKDALSLLMNRFSKTDVKYTNEYIDTLMTNIDKMDDELQREHDERIEMENEDNLIR